MPAEKGGASATLSKARPGVRCIKSGSIRFRNHRKRAKVRGRLTPVTPLILGRCEAECTLV